MFESIKPLSVKYCPIKGRSENNYSLSTNYKLIALDSLVTVKVL